MKRVTNIVALIAAGVALAACTTPASNLALSSLAESGDRFVNRTVGPEYERYVRSDPLLAPDERQVRLDNVEAFRRGVVAARAAASPE